MKVKTANLEGYKLDHAVTECEGGIPEHYSTDWRHGGPIIEREWICADRLMNGSWWACKRTNEGDAYLHQAAGPTPLIAAMRCYVLSRRGEEVDI